MLHKHHVIPHHDWKVRFGSSRGFNAPDNIVWLTVSQHAQAHQLLHELHGRHEDFVAWKVLSGQMSITEGREFVRRQRIRSYQLLPEMRKKTSERMTGRTPWNKGMRTIKIITGIVSKKPTGRPKGFKMSESHKLAISRASMGKLGTRNGVKCSNETIAKRSMTLRSLPKVQCPHCEIKGGYCVMKRHHFDNCKKVKV